MSAMQKSSEDSLQDEESEDQNKNVDIANYINDGYNLLKEGIKCSNALPGEKEWSFFTTSSSFNGIVLEERSNVLKLMNDIASTFDIEENFKKKLLNDKIELLIEANDVILERVGNNIDELNGIKKNNFEPVVLQTVSAQLPINGSWNKSSNTTFSVTSGASSTVQKPTTKSIMLLTGKNIVRPQKFFKDKIDNSNRPWEPRIKDKPNSLKPLAIFLEETECGNEYSHPYEFELERFSPPEDQLASGKIVPPKAISDTPLIEVTTEDKLNELVETLRHQKVFAVDLEHHSFRTYMGITCLMQISTSDSDYLIDTLVLRDKLHILNEIFTRPSIVKVFHGADHDILWLQRDLSIYVVNMFDTYQAAKILGYPTLSLSYLLDKFCNVVPDKKFQLADWRIRPLPDELKCYAREDTHYLIYIYQMLKKELLNQGNGSDNLLRSVINNSTQTCLKRYRKPILTEESCMEFYRRWKKHFDSRQLFAFKELYKWRDNIAREQDESHGYVLPNHMLLQLSENLPREMQGILALCNPPPPLVKSNLLEIHNIICKARDQPLVQAFMKEESRARGNVIQRSKINVDSPLHCPHDLTKNQGFRDNLPTLLNTGKSLHLKENISTTQSQYSVFNVDIQEEMDRQKKEKLQNIKFLSPYQRYLLVKPVIQAEVEESVEEVSNQENKTETINKEDTNNKSSTSTDDKSSSSKDDVTKNAESSQTDDYLTCKVKESLIKMGGSKKRKREEVIEVNVCCDDQLDTERYRTTLPEMPDLSNTQRKRKSSEMLDKPEDDFKNKKSKKDFKTKDAGDRQSTGTEKVESSFTIDASPSTSNNTWKNKHKIRKRKNNRGKCSSHNTPTDASSSCVPDKKKQQSPNNKQNQNQQQSPHNMSNKKKQQNPYNKQQKQKQSGNCCNKQFNSVPFDYSSVDFKQFQGAGKAVSVSQNFKSKFRQASRINKKINKKGKKSSIKVKI